MQPLRASLVRTEHRSGRQGSRFPPNLVGTRAGTWTQPTSQVVGSGPKIRVEIDASDGIGASSCNATCIRVDAGAYIHKTEPALAAERRKYLGVRKHGVGRRTVREGVTPPTMGSRGITPQKNFWENFRSKSCVLVHQNVICSL